jgi:outer membrane protein assembly factor BamB
MKKVTLKAGGRVWRLVASGTAVALLGLGVAGMTAAAAAPARPDPHPGGFNRPGNILIADQFNNRVIEVNRHHQVIWRFGNGSNVPGPHSIVGTNDAERVGSLTLISGTGTPPGADPSCLKKAGCPDNRVILVNRAGRIVWQYGKAGATGSGFDRLNTPVQATYLPDGHILITDQANERVIEVNRQHHIVWQYGKTGVTGHGFNELSNPNSAELLANGHILIADENNNRVIEVTRQHKIVWQYGSPSNTKILNGAAFASRLPDGDTLITDSNNNRVLIVTHAKKVVFDYATNKRPGSMAMPLPTRAVMLRTGDILISDQFNDQVIEINSHKHIVFSQGKIQVDANGFNLLNAPYDAKVVGDYTGLTPPFGFGH